MKDALVKMLRTFPRAILIGTSLFAVWSGVFWLWPSSRSIDWVNIWLAAISGAWVAL